MLTAHTTTPLSLGSLNALNGSYGAGCINHSGSWSSLIGGYAGSLENPKLQVVKANNACVLTLSSVLIGSVKHVPVSTVILTDSYAAGAVAYSAEKVISGSDPQPAGRPFGLRGTDQRLR